MENYKNIKISGMPLVIFVLCSLIVILTMIFDTSPIGLIGGVSSMFVIGIILNEIGKRIPIWKDWLGGGAIFAFVASTAMVNYKIIPIHMVENIKLVMKSGKGHADFLDLFISVLITGSILAIQRKILLKAIMSYIPTLIAGIVGASLFAYIGGLLLGKNIIESIGMYALPIMGGGNGGGAVPMSQIYHSATGGDAGRWYSIAIVNLTVANIVAIIIAGILSKLAIKYPKLSSNGTKLMRNEVVYEKEDNPIEHEKVTANGVTGALIIATTCYSLAYLLAKELLPTIAGFKIHQFAYMVIIVALLNASGILPASTLKSCQAIASFFRRQVLPLLMVGVGVAYTHFSDLVATISHPSVLIMAIFIVIGASLFCGVFGWIFGLYPIEAIITAGLCMCDRGGSGDLEILTASRRMNLLPYAQIASRIGGGIMLIIAGVFFSMSGGL